MTGRKQMDQIVAGMGKRIQERRKKMGVHQYELAEKVGITNTHLSAVEHGKVNPSLGTFLKICEELNVTPDELLLGLGRSNRVLQSIPDALQLCKNEDVELCREFVELLIKRNR